MIATLIPLNEAMQRLSDTIKWGTSAEHPGFDDVGRTAAYHMGDVIDQLHALRSRQIAELRERNLADAAAERVSAEQQSESPPSSREADCEDE